MPKPNFWEYVDDFMRALEADHESILKGHKHWRVYEPGIEDNPEHELNELQKEVGGYLRITDPNTLPTFIERFPNDLRSTAAQVLTNHIDYLQIRSNGMLGQAEIDEKFKAISEANTALGIELSARQLSGLLDELTKITHAFYYLANSPGEFRNLQEAVANGNTSEYKEHSHAFYTSFDPKIDLKELGLYKDLGMLRAVKKFLFMAFNDNGFSCNQFTNVESDIEPEKPSEINIAELGKRSIYIDWDNRKNNAVFSTTSPEDLNFEELRESLSKIKRELNNKANWEERGDFTIFKTEGKHDEAFRVILNGLLQLYCDNYRNSEPQPYIVPEVGDPYYPFNNQDIKEAIKAGGTLYAHFRFSKEQASAIQNALGVDKGLDRA